MIGTGDIATYALVFFCVLGMGFGGGSALQARQ